MHEFTKVSDVASRQAGVVSRQQLLALGFTREGVRWLRKSGLLLRHAHRGIYRVRSAGVTRETQLWAALLWAGDGAVLSHVTAAWLWKLEGVGRRPPQVIDVLVPMTCRLAANKTVCARRTRVLTYGRDFAQLNGLPCTSPTRTLVDLAAVLGPAELEHAFDSLVRRGEEHRIKLFETIERVGRKGRKGIDALITIASRDELGATQSWLEDEVRQVLRRNGIKVPMPQLVIDDASGNFIGRFDFVWPEVGLVLFVDSWDHHSSRAAFEHDRRQQARLQGAGWRTLPITYRRLKSEEAQFIAELKSAIGQTE